MKEEDKNDKKEKQAQYVKEYRRKNLERLKEKDRQRYYQNREKMIQSHKKYHIQHRDKDNENSKEYRRKNKKKVNTRAKEYYRENKEKLSQYHKERYKIHKEKIDECAKRYRNRLKEQSTDFPKNQLQQRSHAYYQKNKEKKKEYVEKNEEKVCEKSMESKKKHPEQYDICRKEQYKSLKKKMDEDSIEYRKKHYGKWKNYANEQYKKNQENLIDKIREECRKQHKEGYKEQFQVKKEEYDMEGNFMECSIETKEKLKKNSGGSLKQKDQLIQTKIEHETKMEENLSFHSKQDQLQESIPNMQVKLERELEEISGLSGISNQRKALYQVGI